MSDELTVAKERLRRINADEAREIVYGQKPDPEFDSQQEHWEWQFDQYINDLIVVSEAYLSQPEPEEVAKSIANEIKQILESRGMVLHYINAEQLILSHLNKTSDKIPKI